MSASIYKGGPKTAAGKARSRFNAFKHGLDAKDESIVNENPQLRAELKSAYFDEHRPQGPTQVYLCDTLVKNDCDRKRVLKIRTEVTNAILEENPGLNLGQALMKDTAGAKLLDRVERRLETYHRAWMRALDKLQRLQLQAIEEEIEALDHPQEEETTTTCITTEAAATVPIVP